MATADRPVMYLISTTAGGRQPLDAGKRLVSYNATPSRVACPATFTGHPDVAQPDVARPGGNRSGSYRRGGGNGRPFTLPRDSSAGR
jgi:hypothetical protein